MDLDLLAGAGLGRPAHGADRQVRHRRKGQVDVAQTDAHVVVFGRRLDQLVVHVGLDEHPMLARRKRLREHDLLDLGVVVAGAERSRVGERAQQNVPAEHVVGREIDAVGP